MNLPLPQQTYQSRSKPFSSERLLNLMLEQAGDAYMLIGTPGLEFYYDVGVDNTVLGMQYIRDYLVVATEYGVSIIGKVNNKIRTVLSRTWQSMGFTITPGNSLVQMASNGDMVLFLNPGMKKIGAVELKNYAESNLESGWSMYMLEDQEDITYTSISYITGVFLASCQINKISYVRYTDVLDTTFKYEFQLDTALSNLTSLKANAREVWAFGANSIEVVSPTGEPGNDFFAHVPGAYINKGCVCKNSIAVYEKSFIFYGNDNVVYMSDGYALKPISTPALLDMIKNWGSLDTDIDRDKVIGQIFSIAGHTFYMLKFKKFGKTLWYDLTTGSWIERESKDGEEWEGDFIERRPNGELIVSSTTTSKMYRMDSSYYTDDGDFICREFVFQTLSTEGKKRMFFYNLTLEIDSGLGPDDSVMLDWSDDGGYTWGKERTVRLGDYGHYNKKIQFRRLGSSTSRTFRIRLSTKSMVNILKASLDVEEGEA
jgi:hypothetical protein